MAQAPLEYVRLLLIKLSNRQSKGHRFNPKPATRQELEWWLARRPCVRRPASGRHSVDCICQGTGLQFPRFSEECPGRSHRPESCVCEGTSLVPKVTLETWRMTLAMLNPYLWGYLPGEEPVEGSVSTETLCEFIRLAIKYEPKTPTLG